MTFNAEAVTAAIHHVTRRYALEPNKLGAVKLHKVLWNTEVQLLRRGYPAIGETFVKKDFGPFAEHLDRLCAALVRRGKLHVSKPTEQYETTCFVGKGEPDRSALTPDQWRVLDQVAAQIVEDHTAGSISEKSHGPVWEAAEMYETLPVAAEAIQWMKPTNADKKRMRERLGI